MIKKAILGKIFKRGVGTRVIAYIGETFKKFNAHKFLAYNKNNITARGIENEVQKISTHHTLPIIYEYEDGTAELRLCHLTSNKNSPEIGRIIVDEIPIGPNKNSLYTTGLIKNGIGIKTSSVQEARQLWEDIAKANTIDPYFTQFVPRARDVVLENLQNNRDFTLRLDSLQVLDNKYPNISEDLLRYGQIKGPIVIKNNLKEEEAMLVPNLFQASTESFLLEKIKVASKQQHEAKIAKSKGNVLEYYQTQGNTMQEIFKKITG